MIMPSNGAREFLVRVTCISHLIAITDRLCSANRIHLQMLSSEWGPKNITVLLTLVLLLILMLQTWSACVALKPTLLTAILTMLTAVD